MAITLYSAEICPFAQRARALLTRLEQPFTVETIDLTDRDPAFLKLSPTGKVPLLVDDGFKLYESDVIADYLAHAYGWDGAYATEPQPRARQRLAMKQWDTVVITAYYRALMDPASFDDGKRAKIEAELDELAETTKTTPAESMLGLHVAPFWARMDWLRAHHPVGDLVDARPELRSWLDATVALPSIAATLPDREEAIRIYTERYVGAAARS